MKQYLSLILFLFLLAACDSSDAPEATGYGYINLNIGTNPEISVARHVQGIPIRMSPLT